MPKYLILISLCIACGRDLCSTKVTQDLMPCYKKYIEKLHTGGLVLEGGGV